MAGPEYLAQQPRLLPELLQLGVSRQLAATHAAKRVRMSAGAQRLSSRVVSNSVFNKTQQAESHALQTAAPHSQPHPVQLCSPPLCRLHGGSRLAAPLVLVLGMQAALSKHLCCGRREAKGDCRLVPQPHRGAAAHVLEPSANC